MNLIIKNLIKRIFGLEFFECLKRWKDYRHNYKTGNFGRYGIDKILEEKLPHKDGFYVELGANNGAKESNSYYFELNKGWRGILIEPTPNLYLSCVKRRGSNNAVFCNACVPFNYNEEFVHMRYSDSMTISDNLNLDIGDHKKHIETGSQFLNEGETTFSFGAKSATLNSLLTPEKIRNTLNMAPQDWLGIFPNQYFFYYDLWALRIDKYFDYDCFQKFKEYSSHKNIKKIYNDIIFKNFFVIKKFKNRFIKVKSAFGGMGIYRLKLVLNSHYNANGGKNSEHVMFHNMITSQNKEILYIDKDLINSYGLNEHIFKGFCYRTFDYFARRLAKKQI